MRNAVGLHQRPLLIGSLLVALGVHAQSCSTKSDSESGGDDRPSTTGARSGSTAGRSGGSGAASGRSGGSGSTGTSGGTGRSGRAGSSGGSGLSGRAGHSGGAGSSGSTGVGGDAGDSGSIATSGDAGGRDDGGGGTGDAGASDYVVALVQSAKANAADITQQDVQTMVSDAVTQAGGLDFIRDGYTVVLKPNLLTTSNGAGQLAPTVNGITTDWRVTLAVARLVREKNPTGRILVMEGSTVATSQAFSALGYTAANFGAYVDEFVALEGSSCTDRSTTGLVQKAALGGKQFWVNERYYNADVLISIGALKTHAQAGITGAVKNLGVGSTPASQYSTSNSASNCSRDQYASGAGRASYVDHSRQGLGQFVHDYYSIRPADFALVDGLQGIQHGPAPQWVAGGNYEKDKMNMRLILASRNAVALDTVEALVMGCDPKAIDHLTKLDSSRLGTTDMARIRLVGNKTVAEVQKQFAGPSFACGNP